jgi:hypothetical protein
VDGFHHLLENGIEDLVRFLGVAVGEQLDRAVRAGEKDRHLLALTLHGALRSEDLLDHVPGSVRTRA